MRVDLVTGRVWRGSASGARGESIRSMVVY